MTRPAKAETTPVDAGIYSGAVDPDATGVRADVDAALLRFQQIFPLGTDLGLGRVFRLLAELDNPHQKLPPTIHVSGTNGKGSVIAFMRSILESAGKSVHVFTSPHLTRFNERIRLQGKVIDDHDLLDFIRAVETANKGQPITFFEIITVMAFLAFASIPADYLLLETGLGGELDATNVIDKPVATAITRISYDHRHFLGDDITSIAAAKAGIMKAGVPCLVADQPLSEVMPVFVDRATSRGSGLLCAGKDWTVVLDEGQHVFNGFGRRVALPEPGLAGLHQYANAAQAIATLLQVDGLDLSDQDIRYGISNVDWPGRLQRLKSGALLDRLPDGWELWVDGGHNDSAGEVLAQQAVQWLQKDGAPLDMILGMLVKKRPDEFIAPLVPYLSSLQTVTIPDDLSAMDGQDLAESCRACGVDARFSHSIADALDKIVMLNDKATPRRVLIAGSIRMVGQILRHHQ